MHTSLSTDRGRPAVRRYVTDRPTDSSKEAYTFKEACDPLTLAIIVFFADLSVVVFQACSGSHSGQDHCSGAGGGGGGGGSGDGGVGGAGVGGGGGSGGSGSSGGGGGGGDGGLVSGGDGGGSSLPPPPPSLTPPPPTRVAGRKRRAAAAESRWQQGAMEQFDAAVHKRRRDGGA